MANIKEVIIPDIGGATDVEVIEIFVKVGDTVAKEDSLLTLESEKASMEIPAPFNGVVKEVKVALADKVSEGDVIFSIEAEGEVADEDAQEAEAESSGKQESAETESNVQEVVIPDIGGATDVEVIEIFVKAGDEVAKEDSLLTLESEKASMEIPAPFNGVIKEFYIKLNDKVSEGGRILSMHVEGGVVAPAKKPAKETAAAKSTAASGRAHIQLPDEQDEVVTIAGREVHAGPGVRRIGREFGIDLNLIKGTGRKGRIVKADLQSFVKRALAGGGAGTGSSQLGFNIAEPPKVDFAKYGEIKIEALSKIKKFSGANLHRNWLTVPHVTQFDEADITEMEAFRQQHKAQAEEDGFKLTPLVFMMKAAVNALKEYPVVNSSLDASGENLILKKYFHIGVAVDTPNGLVVAVIRDVNKKDIMALAKELGDISLKVREKGLALVEMQGSCFTISSLGGIGGTAFTPIVNMPDVAILGVSKARVMPVYENEEFIPRLMLPLSLSYDHRVIDGADAARFITFLSAQLADLGCLI